MTLGASIGALAVLLSLPIVPQEATAHSGGTNADGCHTNRRTGDYHCHSPKVRPPRGATYCHIIDGEARCGYAAATCRDLQAKLGGACRRE